IDSISPDPESETATFIGSGTDTYGTIVGYNWTSSIDGQLSTSAYFSTSDISIGTHTIYFSVQDDEGAWSDTVSRTLEVVDNLMPVISITSPADGSSTPASSIAVSGLVNGTGSLPVVAVNNIVAETTILDFNGTFTATVPLAMGTNAIYANVTDAAGNTNTIYVNVTRTSPPSSSGGSGGGSGGTSNSGSNGISSPAFDEADDFSSWSSDSSWEINGQNYSGFYYDIHADAYGESLTIYENGTNGTRTLNTSLSQNSLVYRSVLFNV
ncbi:hypothetical protein, partial [Methanococcoides seepicolus]